MQLTQSNHEQFTSHYTRAIDELCTIVRAHYTNGNLKSAQQLLRTALQLLEVDQPLPQLRLKLLLIYGQVLIVEHLLTREDPTNMFAIIRQAHQLAEESQDPQRIADALSLLGQAHYFATIVARVQAGQSPNSSQSAGHYNQSLAYQEQALALREDLQDTRGISESCFQVGVIYERWQQYERSQTCYARASQLAEQHNYAFEKTEPTRHRALYALLQGHLDQALILAQKALALREAAHFKPYLPLDHLLLRDIYQAKGDTANAQKHTTSARTIAVEMGYPGLVDSTPDRGIIHNE
ncbi:hypothetical protein KDW_63370 [Dictyobacter vulcani]|uniref:MalT-like TPR region domain-containing protein n=1 Tax=Dictyobacter vulcani TaxID=2607529 RepID=A0A5J4KW27_9CHLR|nr:hypothetical protein [Dictyobacter vulcani]GER92175.1 hypothetical protein KDW_63370 [Dictyobacter vulcani]